MKVIADIGATSGQWRILTENGKIFQVLTEGMNVSNVDEITHWVDTCRESFFPYQSADTLYAYVAGYVGSPTQSMMLNMALSQFFPNASIHLSSDHLGAARGLAGKNSAYIGILGTGANFAFFDGEKLHRHRPALGFILGDEGSGADIGKSLLRDFLRHDMPTELSIQFQQKYDIEEAKVIQSVYQDAFPKRYLASFVPFLLENVHHRYSHLLLMKVFDRHFDAFLKEEQVQHEIHYTGSIAYLFGNILRSVAASRRLSIGKIVDSPIAALTLYHQQYG